MPLIPDPFSFPGNATGFGVSSQILDIATPNAPTDITAKSLGTDGILVNWTVTAFNAQNATIQRSDDGGTTWTTLSDSIDPNDGHYTDSSGLPGVSYKYRVANTRTNAFGEVTSEWATTVPVANVSDTEVVATDAEISMGGTRKGKTTVSERTKDSHLPVAGNYTIGQVTNSTGGVESRIHFDAGTARNPYTVYKVTADVGTPVGDYKVTISDADDPNGIRSKEITIHVGS